MKVLGLETSCDETAAAIVRLRAFDPQENETRMIEGEVLSNQVFSQIDDHEPYGGVVPEIAARAHVTKLDGLIETALQEANCSLSELDAIAATAGPGLIGGVMVGLVTGKSLALAAQKPFMGINHLEAHVLTIRLTSQQTQLMPFPYLVLLVSGGHCQLICVHGLGDYEIYGSTLDDAAGEAFDKAAKLMGLGYPGGPEIEKYARLGDPQAVPLPRPLKHDGSCNFSFSGLKTALRMKAKAMEPVSEQDIANLAASFQTALTDCLSERCVNAMQRFAENYPEKAHHLVIAGGVAANQFIYESLATIASAYDFTLEVAPPQYCTDNAAMIAWAGAERLLHGQSDPLTLAPRARWPLTELTPPF
ncbi:MAG: tRNA (adenosine(37)-N6)-threonylcarbamoyltransferase complex transferase subunit TsaD [Parvibaculales bacterium]